MVPGLILQHEESGPPALFAEWCERRGIAYEILRVWEDGLPDAPDGLPWLCALGSEHSPAEQDVADPPGVGHGDEDTRRRVMAARPGGEREPARSAQHRARSVTASTTTGEDHGPDPDDGVSASPTAF